MLQFLLRKVLISATIEEKIAQQKGWFHKRVPGKNQMKAVMGGWFVFFFNCCIDISLDSFDKWKSNSNLMARVRGFFPIFSASQLWSRVNNALCCGGWQVGNKKMIKDLTLRVTNAFVLWRCLYIFKLCFLSY